MYRFSFKIKHKNCSETALSTTFPKHHITVVDIQSRNPREKQYFYYITGSAPAFDPIIRSLKHSKTYKVVKEVERSQDTLLLLVVLHQTGFIQNIIQKYHGFFIDLHTVYGGYEYWHIGVVDHEAIEPMRREIMKMGKIQVLYLGEVDFAHKLLSSQQKKIFQYAYEQGYYEIPRKTTIARIAMALKLNAATVGEHLMKAENKLIKTMAKKI